MLALAALNAHPAPHNRRFMLLTRQRCCICGACGKAGGGSVLSRGYTNFGGESNSCLPQERL